MNKQGSVTMASIERYREEVDGDEQRRRNKNVSNWLMYCTKEEVIDVISNAEELNLYEEIMLHLYSGNKQRAAEL
jgi:hypothetical protein